MYICECLVALPLANEEGKLSGLNHTSEQVHGLWETCKAPSPLGHAADNALITLFLEETPGPAQEWDD